MSATTDDVSRRITRAIGNYPDHVDITHVLRGPSERIADALGLDPHMPVAELQRRLRIAERVLRVAANDSGESWIQEYSQDESNVIWDWIDRLVQQGETQ